MPVALKQPKNWPHDVIYLTTPTFSKSIRPGELRAASSLTSDLPLLKVPDQPCPSVHVHSIVGSTHPANGQSGLFADRNLRPDTFICFYLGFVHSQSEANDASNYDLSLDRELGIGVEATKMGNEARFINDYRGVQDSPNAEFRDCLAEIGGEVVERRIGVFVLSPGKKGGKRAKGINKGEEIVVSYGKGFWSHRRTDKGGAAPAKVCSFEP